MGGGRRVDSRGHGAEERHGTATQACSAAAARERDLLASTGSYRRRSTRSAQLAGAAAASSQATAKFGRGQQDLHRSAEIGGAGARAAASRAPRGRKSKRARATAGGSLASAACPVSRQGTGSQCCPLYRLARPRAASCSKRPNASGYSTGRHIIGPPPQTELLRLRASGGKMRRSARSSRSMKQRLVEPASIRRASLRILRRRGRAPSRTISERGNRIRVEIIDPDATIPA